MSLASAYHQRSQEMLNRAWEVNMPVIARIAPLIGASVAGGGILHAFGSGHSEVLIREIIGRAGGLACVSGVLDPTAGFVENLPNYGARLIERYDRQYELRAGEVILIVSNSGCNAAPIDVALHARSKGVTVVALCSVAMSKGLTSRHPGGQRLCEVADLVLDNGGVLGDTIVELLPASEQQPAIYTGPTSTFVGASILNWLMLETMQWLRDHGHPLPILRSQNLPGAIPHNRTVGERYKHRLTRQLA
jgi:uncharacterized phosphosugar-binding protein